MTFQEPEVEPDPKGEERELPARAFHFGCQNMVRLASLPTKYTMLVVGTQSHSRGKGPVKTHPQDLGPPSQFLK